MAIKFYNTLTREKEEFRPMESGKARIYSCGPTVYDYAHIGNFRSYVFSDLLRRYLEYRGITVKLVMNITDVDDKTIKGSRKKRKPLKEFTEKYRKAFFEDMKTLNMKPADLYPQATGHIEEMTRLVKGLLEKGIAYKAKDGIYFSISKFRGYGKLARLDMKGLKPGIRIRTDEYDKKSINDFVLWKFWDKDDGNVFWKTDIGKGRPGWHIECSAMSMKYLGKTFDIHSGGVDLIFPHHQNEMAQSEAFTGKKLANFWLHNEHLFVNGKKMSKSLGNFFTLRDLTAKGFHPRAIRFFLLSGHYRSRLNLTEQALRQAGETVKRLDDFVAGLQSVGGKDSEEAVKKADNMKKKFESAMDDDLNTPEALSSIFNFIKEANILLGKEKVGRKNAEYITSVFREIDKVLGLSLFKKEEKIDNEIKLLIQKREEFRKKNQWDRADKIRAELKKKGIILEDSKHGVKIKRTSDG